MSNMVQATKLKSIDKSLGFGYGIMRGLFLAASVFLIAGFIVPGVLKNSFSGPFLHKTSCFVLDILPNEISSWCYGNLKQYNKYFNEASNKEVNFDQFLKMKP